MQTAQSVRTQIMLTKVLGQGSTLIFVVLVAFKKLYFESYLFLISLLVCVYIKRGIVLLMVFLTVVLEICNMKSRKKRCLFH